MSAPATGDARGAPDGDRLAELLAVEHRLQELVRAARDDADRRIAEARAERERRLTAARETATHADTERLENERVAHAAALSAIETASQAAIAAITGITEKQVDELARWAVAQAMGAGGEAA